MSGQKKVTGIEAFGLKYPSGAETMLALDRNFVALQRRTLGPPYLLSFNLKECGTLELHQSVASSQQGLVLNVMGEGLSVPIPLIMGKSCLVQIPVSRLVHPYYLTLELAGNYETRLLLKTKEYLDGLVLDLSSNKGWRSAEADTELNPAGLARIPAALIPERGDPNYSLIQGLLASFQSENGQPVQALPGVAVEQGELQEVIAEASSQQDCIYALATPGVYTIGFASGNLALAAAQGVARYLRSMHSKAQVLAHSRRFAKRHHEAMITLTYEAAPELGIAVQISGPLVIGEYPGEFDKKFIGVAREGLLGEYDQAISLTT